MCSGYEKDKLSLLHLLRIIIAVWNGKLQGDFKLPASLILEMENWKTVKLILRSNYLLSAHVVYM